MIKHSATCDDCLIIRCTKLLEDWVRWLKEEVSAVCAVKSIHNNEYPLNSYDEQTPPSCDSLLTLRWGRGAVLHLGRDLEDVSIIETDIQSGPAKPGKALIMPKLRARVKICSWRSF